MTNNTVLNFKNHNITVNCDDPKRLEMMADIVNKKFNNMIEHYHNSMDDIKALFILALMQQDEIETLKQNNDNEFTLLKQTEEYVINSLNHMHNDINDITEKIQNS